MGFPVIVTDEEKAAKLAEQTRAADAKVASDKAYSDIPTPGINSPTIGGYVKSLVSGGPPQASIPMGDVPGVIAGVPGALVRDVKQTYGSPQSAQDTGFGTLGEHLDPGEPGDTSAHDSDNDRILRELQFRQPATSPAAKAFFEHEGYSKAPVGGAALYDEAFVNDPARTKQAMTSLADTQAQHKSALADFYKGQTERDVQAAAAAKQAAAEDQVNLQARQQKLDQAAQYYTNDLQDQGKFWTNPGNIVSAIAFSLMPIFSNDPAIGAKLINQAIDRDMANRQHAANQTLGALQSNLAGYHKIAGDRQAGDLLAQAEAHRIAAQEIARIGAQFEGPISQKQMQLAIADQKQRQDVAQMEFYKANVHINPSKMDPGLHNARVLGGPDGYQQGVASLGGVPAPTAPINTQGKPGTAVNGTIAGTPSTSGAMSPTVRAIVNTGGMRGVLKASNAGIIQDNQVQDAVKAGMYAEGHARYPNEPPDQAFAKVLNDADERLKPFAVEIAKNAGSRRLIASLQGKAAIIERLERGEGRDPNEFISWASKNLPGGLVNQYRQLFDKDPAKAGNQAEKRAALRQQAVELYESQLQGALNANMHDLNGGAVSDSEKERTEKEVSAAKSWQQQKAFLDRKAQSLQAYVDDNKAALTPAAMMLYRIRSNGGTLSSGLPRQGQPMPAAPEQPGYQGGQSGAAMNSSRADSALMSTPPPVTQ